MSGARRGVYVALVCTFLLAQAWVHARAGFGFPPPWIDEAQFLWQAKAFADHGTLTAPQLHPERPILWMPAGWFVVTGAALRVLGFDFELARGLSFAALCGAFVALAYLLRRLPHANGALLLAGGFFLGASFVAVGNIARMEALLLLGALAGFALLQAGRFSLALALLALLPLVHPNGLWFLAGGVAFTLPNARGAAGLARPRGAQLAVWLAVGVAWLAQAALVGVHFEAFRHDLAYQLARKATAGDAGVFLDGRLLALALLLALAWRLRRALADARLLACLAVSALAAHSFGQEYWYEVHEQLFYLLLSVFALEAALAWLAERPASARRPRLAQACVLAALLLANGAARRLPDPIGYPANLVWHRMRIPDATPYLSAEDRAFVRGFLVALAPPGELPSVRFQPAAEALFYADLDGREIRVSEPVFHAAEPDWYLLRTSAASAGGRIERERFARAGVDPSGEAHRIRTRGASERWYAIRAGAVGPDAAPR